MSGKDFLETKKYFYLTAALFVFACFLGMGLQPLKLEEPRRAMVALNMVFSGNIWVPITYCEPYLNKPPIFSWLLAFVYWFTGSSDEWVTRLPHTLAYFGFGYATFKFAGVKLCRLQAIHSGFFTVIAFELLFYYSTIAEIDIFFSLVVFLSMISVFYFWEKKSFYSLFLFGYGLMAIGLLTKGLPAVPFYGFTLIAWFLYNRAWKKLFHPGHFLGAGIFILLTGGYFLIYNQYEDPIPYVNRLFNESANRVSSSESQNLFKHLLIMPLEMLKIALPATLIAFISLSRQSIKALKSNRLIVFCILAFCVNFPVYWISVGAKISYTYPILPFFILVCIHLFYNSPDKKKKDKILQSLNWIIGILLFLGSLVLQFIPDLQSISGLWLGNLLLTTLVSLWLIGLYFQKFKGLTALILIVIILRIGYDITAIPQQALDSEAQYTKSFAKLAADEIGDQSLFLYDVDCDMDVMCVPYNLLFYLEAFLEEPVCISDEMTNGYYLTIPESVGEKKVVMEFEAYGRQYSLVK